jgi:outer membrane protein
MEIKFLIKHLSPKPKTNRAMPNCIQFKNHLVFVIIFTLISQISFAQNPNGLKDLILLAEKNYPSIAAKKAQSLGAQKDIAIQKNTILPSVDAAYQTDYATYNNITGMTFPQYIIPISGPPSTKNNFSGVFGSAASILMNWQPVTFGQRPAQINVAQQNYQLSLADESNTIYQLQLNVIAVYLNIVLADELLKVYQQNIIRTQTQLRQIRSMVVSGLKPGTDTSLYKSELSKATIDLYNLQQYRAQQQNLLGMVTGNANLAVAADSSFVQHIPGINLQDSIMVHPLILSGEQLVKVQEANKLAIKKSLMPKLSIWSTIYGRGSGIRYDGEVKSAAGLGFSRFNYGVGMQLSVPILKYVDVRLQLQKQDALIKSYQSQLQQTQLQLLHDSLDAQLVMANSIKVMKETAVQTSAANAAYRSMLSRYNAGLANFTELIQTQYALQKAETDAKQAVLNIWEALLKKASAEGDVNVFLKEVK